MRNEVRELRMMVWESQEALAEVLGVSRQTVNAIENGRRVPTLEVAIRIARRYGKRVEEVFDPDREPWRPPPRDVDVVVGLNEAPNKLVIEMWHEGRGTSRLER